MSVFWQLVNCAFFYIEATAAMAGTTDPTNVGMTGADSEESNALVTDFDRERDELKRVFLAFLNTLMLQQLESVLHCPGMFGCCEL